MHPFVHLSFVFWLYTALQCRSSISSNSLVFHTSGCISSSPAAFLLLIFLSIESSSSCVNCPSLMSNYLLLIFVICLCVTFGRLPSIRFSWLVAFSLAFAVIFLLLASFTVCHAILDCLLIWFCMFSVCSFRYMLANSFCAFLSFRVLILVGFLLLHFSRLHAFF